MANKLTKKDYFGVLKELAEQAGNQGAVEFCEKEIERLANRKATETKTQKANKELAEVVFDALTNLTEKVTVSDLIKADERLGEYSTQKLTPILKGLVGEGRVAKIAEGKKNFYVVAD